MLKLKSWVRSRYDVHKFLLIDLKWLDDYLPDIDDEYNTDPLADGLMPKLVAQISVCDFSIGGESIMMKITD